MAMTTKAPTKSEKTTPYTPTFIPAEAPRTPDPLALATRETEALLTRFGKLSDILTETGKLIPATLAEEQALGRQLGLNDTATARAELQAATSRRTTAARQRAAALEQLLVIEGELVEASTSLGRVRHEYGEGIVREFSQRWAAQCRGLALLRSEAIALGAALNVAVACPPPYRAQPDPLYLHEARLKAVEPQEPVAPPQLPPAVVALGDLARKLDSARGVCASVKQAVELTKRYFVMARDRGTRSEMGGLFEVVKPFVILGSAFERGQLVDRTVMPDGLLERFWVGKHLQPAGIGAVVSAA
jgi:hypothetical protein